MHAYIHTYIHTYSGTWAHWILLNEEVSFWMGRPGIVWNLSTCTVDPVYSGHVKTGCYREVARLHRLKLKTGYRPFRTSVAWLLQRGDVLIGWPMYVRMYVWRTEAELLMQRWKYGFKFVWTICLVVASGTLYYKNAVSMKTTQVLSSCACTDKPAKWLWLESGISFVHCKHR